MTGTDGPAQRHRFETVASEDIYRGRILVLRADQVRMPGGGLVRREVVEHFGAVVIAALDDDGRLAMVHQYRHPLGTRLWELPAGLLDGPGERAVDAAARELAEETGLVAERWDTLIDLASSPGFTDEAVRVFLARDLSTVHRAIPDGDEETDLVVRWIALPEAIRMVFAGDVINGAAVAGILATQAVLAGTGATRPADAPWRDRPTRLAARS